MAWLVSRVMGTLFTRNCCHELVGMLKRLSWSPKESENMGDFGGKCDEWLDAVKIWLRKSHVRKFGETGKTSVT